MELGIKKVDFFDLLVSNDKKRYENLMNNENAEIVKEEFSYTKSGNPVITVWYSIDEL